MNKTQLFYEGQYEILSDTGQLKKSIYVKPEIQMIRLELEGLLGNFSGDHENATHHSGPIESEEEDGNPSYLP